VALGAWLALVVPAVLMTVLLGCRGEVCAAASAPPLTQTSNEEPGIRHLARGKFDTGSFSHRFVDRSSVLIQRPSTASTIIGRPGDQPMR